MSIRENGMMVWTGPTLDPPPGHSIMSSGTLSETTFVFLIDREHDDVMDDSFNGIWDEIPGTGTLFIDGNGSGAVQDRQITGTLDGTFKVYAPARIYCTAKDHRFTLIRQ